MKLNKKIIPGVALLLLGSVLAGCGSASSSNSMLPNGLKRSLTTTTNNQYLPASSDLPKVNNKKTSQNNGEQNKTTVSSTQITTTTVPIYGSSAGAVHAPVFPAPSVLQGSYLGGALQSLGPINRISFVPLRSGENSPPYYPPLGFPEKNMVSIGYRSFGQGQPIVLIGGVDTTMTTWSPSLLLSLAQNFHVIIFDLPGIGYSPATNQKINVDNMTGDVAGFISSLGLQSPIVLGWGFGGTIALKLAESHPTLISGLILVDSTAGGKTAKFAENAFVNVGPYNYTGLVKIWFPSSEASLARSYIKSLAQYTPDILLPAAVSISNTLERDLKSVNIVYDRLPSIDLPTLIISGAKDSLFPVADSHLLHEKIHESKLVIFRDSGYASLFADTSQFVSSVNKFESTTTTTTTTTTS